MKKKHLRFHIGLRTVKTAIAVIISMVLVDIYGSGSDSRLIFAMLGAMAAVMPTFKDSLVSCLTQFVGLFFGAVAGIVLRLLPLPDLVSVGIGIILVITLYNGLRVRFSPSLPCFIVVLLCITPDIEPVTYAIQRFWDTAIGLAIGMIINMLIFPYDNSRQIRFTIESLEEYVLRFLEDLFDGDDILPDTERIAREIDSLSGQLNVFAGQKMLLHLKRQKQELESFRLCEEKARRLIAHMQVLCHMAKVGRLGAENRLRLLECGADISGRITHEAVCIEDTVTNYHISRLLDLRQELIDTLKSIKTVRK